MLSILLISLWMASGATLANRLSPPGSWPMAMILGPLWMAVDADMDHELAGASS